MNTTKEIEENKEAKQVVLIALKTLRLPIKLAASFSDTAKRMDDLLKTVISDLDNVAPNHPEFDEVIASRLELFRDEMIKIADSDPETSALATKLRAQVQENKQAEEKDDCDCPMCQFRRNMAGHLKEFADLKQTVTNKNTDAKRKPGGMPFEPFGGDTVENWLRERAGALNGGRNGGIKASIEINIKINGDITDLPEDVVLDKVRMALSNAKRECAAKKERVMQ